ncbi:hypothetical protein OXI21_07945 [Ignatzschineria sp. RMDPL8A]|uniref:hypothetical protein n=1 Tax=Ignatzschineria sp. RMDPL8A TaxID=2999236 RepID=UPI00244674D5|nr:hypothetical protein [Ignatzschineria sp. RMDPL8A]MDG9730341.1 hypothetical protein [Ignatzschineria sp. RMDPL8A]
MLRVSDLLKQLETIPDDQYTERIPLLITLINLSDIHDYREISIYARELLLDAYSQTQQYKKMIRIFSWLINEWEVHPKLVDEAYLLAQTQWIHSLLPDYLEPSIHDLNALSQKLRQVVRRYHAPLLEYYQTQIYHALSLYRYDVALKYLKRWRAYNKKVTIPCPICYCRHEIAFCMALNRLKEAKQAEHLLHQYDPSICMHSSIYSSADLMLLNQKLGLFDLAETYYQELKQQAEFLHQYPTALGQMLEYLVKIKREEEARALFDANRRPFTDEVPDRVKFLYYARASGINMALKDKVYHVAQTLADRFDQRNRNHGATLYLETLYLPNELKSMEGTE